MNDENTRVNMTIDIYEDGTGEVYHYGLVSSMSTVTVRASRIDPLTPEQIQKILEVIGDER